MREGRYSKGRDVRGKDRGSREDGVRLKEG